MTYCRVRDGRWADDQVRALMLFERAAARHKKYAFRGERPVQDNKL